MFLKYMCKKIPMKPTPRPRRNPIRIFTFILTLAAILTAGGLLLGLYWTSASQNKAIESMAHANQTTVFQTAVSQAVATQAGDGSPSIMVDTTGALMALVPAGQFHMGSLYGEEDELPVRTIMLDDYYIDVFEVTNNLYQECVKAGVCHPPIRSSSQRRAQYYGNLEYEDYPVVYVRYEDAEAFCEWRKARLPTEAEWEKAARGGLEGMDYPWGDQSPVCTPGAPNGANSDKCSPAETWPVGSFAPNGYGLYDMSGNVWEWVADWYDNTYNPDAPSNNPTGPTTGVARILRGGSWNNIGLYLRVSTRLRNLPVDGNYNIGFRCARSP